MVANADFFWYCLNLTNCVTWQVLARDMSWWRFWWPSTNWSSGHRVRRRQIRQDPETERDDPCVLNSSHKLKSFQAHCKEFSRAFLTSLKHLANYLDWSANLNYFQTVLARPFRVGRRTTHFIGDTAAFIIPLEEKYYTSSNILRGENIF